MSKVSCINTTANLDKRDVKTFKADIKSGAKPEDVVEILISDALAEHESLLEIIRSKGGVVEGYVPPVEELKPAADVKGEEIEATKVGKKKPRATPPEKKAQAAKKTEAKPSPTSARPGILTESKAKIIRSMAKDAGVKKGSPGYEDAMTEIASKYDDELERAEFSLPFEEFKALPDNGRTSDEQLRVIYDSVREELGIKEKTAAPVDEPLDEEVRFQIAVDDSNQAIIDEIDELSKKAKARKAESEPEGMSIDLVLPELDYLSDKEKTRFHDLKQSLPSQGQEATDAKARNKARVAARKNAKEKTVELADTSDVGGEMSFNRRGKGITASEIRNTENETERVALAVKSKLWKRPDYQVMVDEGVQPAIAHVIKQIYDSIPTKPPFTGDKYLNAYAETVEATRQAIDDVLLNPKKLAAIMAAINVQIQKRQAVFGGKGMDISELMNKALDPVTGADPLESITDIVFPENDEGARWGRKNVEGNDKANATNNLYKNTTISVEMLTKALIAIDKKGWPAKQESWQRSYRIEEKDGEFRLIKNKRYTPESIHKSKDDAIEAARALTKKSKDDKFKEPETPVENSRRLGDDSRGGRNVSSKELQERFGLKAINFGNWMSKPAAAKERQGHVNSAYDALSDLAITLNLPDKAMSFDGQLGLAIGAQGAGGRNAAHFVAGVNEINLTRTSGAGSLAHEWAHMLDHYFGVQSGMAASSDPFASWATLGVRKIKEGSEIRPEMAEAFGTIVEVMRKKKESIEAMKAREQKHADLAVESLSKFIDSNDIRSIVAGDKDAEAALANIEKGGKSDYTEWPPVGRRRKPEGYTSADVKLIADLAGWDFAKADKLNSEAGAVRVYVGDSKMAQKQLTLHTDFYRNASGLESKSGKPYWTTPHEMFARAFETYVTDKLDGKDKLNSYLVSEWKNNTDGEMEALFNDGPNFRYPRDADRAAINEAFDTLIGGIKTKETDSGVALYSRNYKTNPAAATVAEINAELSTAVSRLDKAIKQRVQIVQTTSDLPVDVPTDVRGMYYDGIAYVVADNTPVSDAKTVLTHEIVGHMGLEEMLGDSFSDVIGKIKRMKRVGNKQVAEIVKTLKRSYVDENGNYALTPNQEAREILAHIAETDHNHSLVKQIIAKLKLWLARMGLANKDSAEVGYLIAQAARYVEGKGDAVLITSTGNIEPYFAKAYHGSPHKHDGRLDPSKIGTGEGAQAYGYGYYVAESEKVADSYRVQLSDAKVTFDGKVAKDPYHVEEGRMIKESYRIEIAEIALSLRGRYKNNKGNMQKAIIENGAKYINDRDSLSQYRKDTNYVLSNLDRFDYEKGHLYEYEIDDDAISKMLDWDAPLSEQSDSIQGVAARELALETGITPAHENFEAMVGLAKNQLNAKTGEDLYKSMVNRLGMDAEVSPDEIASRYLWAEGVPGIKYYDGQSRGEGEGTRNFVIFPGAEDIATPISRNGVMFSRETPGTPEYEAAKAKGLDMSKKARMQRARDMGFDTDTVWYHGTGRQFSSFDPKAEGEFSSIDTNNVVTFTTDENIAKRYAKESAVSEKQWDDELNRYIKNGNPRIVEAYLPSNIKNIDAIGRHHDSKWMIGEQEKARNQGFDGVRFNGLADDVYYNPLAGASDITQIFDPSNIRSVNAAFDPMEKDSAELLFSRGDGNWKDDSTGFAIPDETWKTVAIRKLQDKFKVLKDLQANIIESGGEISEEANAYIAEELFHGKAENDIAIMRDEFVAPMAEKMAESGITQAQLDKYLYALHAEERNDHIASINPDMPDGGSGMKTSKAKKIIADIEQGGKAADYKDLAGIVHAMLRERRRVIIDGGLEDDGLIDAWEDKYKNYVPLKGFAENELDDSRPKTGQGFNIGGKESKRALGRGSEAASPSSFAIIDLTETLVRNRKNEVGNALLKLIEDNPQESYWASYTEDNPDTDRRIVKVDGKDVVKETVIPMALMKDQYFTTKRNGKTHYMKLEDPRLMDAMKNLGVEHGGTVIKTMGNITRIMSALNTSYSPEFITGNFLRDVQTAVLNLKAEQTASSGKINGEEIVSQTVKDIPLAMRSVYASLSGKKIKGAKGKEFQDWFEEFKKAGAKTGWFDMKDLDGQAREVEQLVEMSSGTTKGNALKWAKSAAGVVENMNSAVENAVRLSAYVNARRAGISEQKAASLAKNMTVNFNRKGEVGATLNALFMFSNASIQGVANFARTMGTLKGDKSLKWQNLNNAQKLGVGMAAGAFFIAMANRSSAGEDDDGVNWFDKVPDYVKERNIVIMKSLFGGEQDGTYWKIPLPYGYNIFNVLGDSMESVAFSDKPVTNTAGRLTLATLGSFSPIGFQDSKTVMGGVLKNATPTVFKPVTDIALNENFFGSSIYSENFPFGTPKPDSAMARRSTPEGYRKVAEWLNEGTGGSKQRPGAVDINPDVMRYIADYFGGAAYGFFGSKVPDVVHRAINDVDVEVNRMPFVSRISGRVMHYDDMGDFYERRDEINQIHAEYKTLEGGERAGFYRKYGDKMRLSAGIKSAEKRLKLLRKQRDRVYANEDLSFAQRDERLKDVQAKMKKVVDEINKNYNNALTKSLK